MNSYIHADPQAENLQKKNSNSSITTYTCTKILNVFLSKLQCFLYLTCILKGKAISNNYKSQYLEHNINILKYYYNV